MRNEAVRSGTAEYRAAEEARIRRNMPLRFAVEKG